MEKFNEFLKNLTSNCKDNIKKYAATNIVIILTTLVLTFTNYNLFYSILGSFVLVATICAINFFTIESFCKKINTRVISYIVGFLIAIAFERLLNFNSSIIIQRLLIGYLFIIFLIGIIKVIKDSNLEIPQYLARVFKNIFNTAIVYAILNIGLTILTTIFILLILNSRNSFEIILRLQIALLGLFFIPANLLAITNINVEITKFIKTIISYVLLPLTIIATLIIYIYMAKIFILWQIPSNSIFRILTGIFVVAFPVWTMAHTFKDENKFIKISAKLMPIAFIPFVGLQIYSLSARCIENGITPIRYLGIMFIIFEIIAIFLSLYKEKKYLIHILTSTIVIIIVSTILPIVNLQTLSNISQSNRLKNAWQEGKNYEDLTKEQIEQARGAYLYLKPQENSEKYIPEYITQKDLDYYKLYHETIELPEQKTEVKRVSYSLPTDGVIYVKGYAYIQELSTVSYQSTKVQLKNIKLNDAFNIDIQDYILNVTEKNSRNPEEAQEYIKQNRILKINQNIDLYIKDLQLSYSINDNGNLENVTYLYINGYMLMKEV